MGLRKAREAAEAYLRSAAAREGTEIAAMGEPVAEDGGVRVDARTADGRSWKGWAGTGSNPPAQVTGEMRGR